MRCNEERGRKKPNFDEITSIDLAFRHPINGIKRKQEVRSTTEGNKRSNFYARSIEGKMRTNRRWKA